MSTPRAWCQMLRAEGVAEEGCSGDKCRDGDGDGGGGVQRMFRSTLPVLPL